MVTLGWTKRYLRIYAGDCLGYVFATNNGILVFCTISMIAHNLYCHLEVGDVCFKKLEPKTKCLVTRILINKSHSDNHSCSDFLKRGFVIPCFSLRDKFSQDDSLTLYYDPFKGHVAFKIVSNRGILL